MTSLSSLRPWQENFRKVRRYGLVNAAIFVSFSQVYYILSRCSYLKGECPDKDKKGIKRLLNNGTYSAAFPLHDVSFICWTCFCLWCCRAMAWLQKKVNCHSKTYPKLWNVLFRVCVQSRYWTRSRDPNCESERYNLYKHWARFFCFFKEQPLDLVRWDLEAAVSWCLVGPSGGQIA